MSPISRMALRALVNCWTRSPSFTPRDCNQPNQRSTTRAMRTVVVPPRRAGTMRPEYSPMMSAPVVADAQLLRKSAHPVTNAGKGPKARRT